MNEQEIFEQALELPPEDRSAFVNDACSADQKLYERVQQLLKLHEAGGAYFEQPAANVLATEINPVTEQPGDTIGPYKLLQQIGEGGMGVVYMAEQTEPVERRVALKIIKPGMDTQQVIARFEAERQALAMMDHPNIARVLDAGQTNRGSPYFVMELVKGVPITEYCDAHHLSVNERLDVMLCVCQAVQHAHQKGIIHRDLKPSNILVCEYDGKPVPKVIDFGVAKATAQRLTEKTMFTEYGQLIGTFQYMSPEQARFNQLDVDTRSDIYSLGVLLYELLAGSTPIEKERLQSAALDEILRIINEEEPLRPSTRLSSSEWLPSIAANRRQEPKKLTGIVSGELDWIVMKCLEKEREKRYGSVEQLAEEFRRFLAGEPIQARSTTMRQRLWRRYRRNVALVAGSYTVFTFAIQGINYVALFCIIQFLIRSPHASEFWSGLGPTAVTVLLCLAGVEMGIATVRGKRRGQWMSLVAFVLFSVGCGWSLYWAIAISGELSDIPIYSFQSFIPSTIDGRNTFIRNCVIGYSLLGMTWSFVGLALQVHNLSSQPPGQNVDSRTRR